MRSKRPLRTGVYPKQMVDFSNLYSDFILTLGSGTGSATTFLGVARKESSDGKKLVRTLTIESYERHANRMLRRICSEVKEKYNLRRIVIVHALGTFTPGEPVVFVGVSSSRRVQSFRALRVAVERYKKEPALFKREEYPDGSTQWIH